jgi:EAL domain-containing protein (putative c-di-GMP-specific phosphodiesterase class I)
MRVNTGARRVVLLDDDPTTLLLVSHQLQGHGLDVIACREIEAAEAILDHTGVDAVVTDLCLSPLGGLDGVRLARHVATHYPEVELIVVSGHVTEEVRGALVSLGAKAVLEKPVDPKLLAMQLLRGTGLAAGAPEGSIDDIENLDDFLLANPIYAVLQPIVGLQDGAIPFEVHGVESLARTPGGSLLRNPELLFGYASRKERLFETDMMCVRAALAEAGGLANSCKLFINIQPRSLSRRGFTEKVGGLVREAGYTPDRIVFELTEQETILNPRAFAATLSEVRREGFRVAMDDYGMGHSNLRFLLDFRPDYVKLSGYFCRGIARDPYRQEIVRSTARMLKDLGTPAIMEGVETAEELAVVRDLGVEYGQGYHFARPQRAKELFRTELLKGGAPSISGQM